jgi:hypothetical protein
MHPFAPDKWLSFPGSGGEFFERIVAGTTAAPGADLIEKGNSARYSP